MGIDLATRSRQNPLLTSADIAPSNEAMEIACVLNPGAFRFQGRVSLLLRVAERPRPVPGRARIATLGEDGTIRILDFAEDDPALDCSDPRILRYGGRDYPTTLSHFRLVSSSDGVAFVEDDFSRPLVGNGTLETLGIEDCRVVQHGSIYHLTFTIVSEHGVGVGRRSTEDWITFQDHGMIFPPHNKDCAIFEEPIGGRYFALHRPTSPEFGGNYIWLAESPDLDHWGHHRCIAHTRPDHWDSARIGAGAAPIRTSCGWLVLYHGATAQHRYCFGLLLLELEKPWNVIARSDGPIMEPVADYERVGFFGDVIFTNGHVIDGDRLTVYYGAADSVICSSEFSIKALLGSLGLQGGRS